MIPRYIDIHTHVQFEAFKVDARDVAERALHEGVWMIQVGTQRDTSEAAILFASSFKEGVYATVGLHPIHTSASFHDTKELGAPGKEFTSRGEIFDFASYKKLAEHPKVLAIGECGLDYYRLSEETKIKQVKTFEEQIHLANELHKPLMLHIRNPLRSSGSVASAYEDAALVLKAHAKIGGNVHFFAGTWEEAKRFLDLGFTLSFTGVVTFAHQYDEVIKNTPLDMIMSETDAPYVAPVPYRGKRNEPLYVKEVVKRIAEIKGEDFEKVRDALVANAERVFKVA